MINSCNEWDPLEEIVVGIADYANWPSDDPVFAEESKKTLWTESPVPSGPVPQWTQLAARQALTAARYGDSGTDYFHVWLLDGVNVVHPYKPDWAGQNMIGKVKDTSGLDIILAMTTAAQRSTDGKAFVDTEFPRPGSTEPVPKLQYVSVAPAARPSIQALSHTLSLPLTRIGYMQKPLGEGTIDSCGVQVLDAAQKFLDLALLSKGFDHFA